MAAIPYILEAVGAAVAVKSSLDQQAAIKATGAYNAAVQKNDVIQQNLIDRENIRRQRAQDQLAIGAMRARMAGSGVEMSGSPLAVLGYNAANLELSAQDAAYQASTSYSQGMSRVSAINFNTASALSAQRTRTAATILSGVGSTYQTGVKTGIFG